MEGAYRVPRVDLARARGACIYTPTVSKIPESQQPGVLKFLNIFFLKIPDFELLAFPNIFF
jgi:hypothetical protein